MKSKLQYLYSISVFVGVLMTSYLMTNREGNARIPTQLIQDTQYRTDAQVFDPAINQLLDIEYMLSKENESPSLKSYKVRAPSVLESQYK